MAANQKSSFGARLCELRKDRGLTQEALARIAIGVSPSYIARLETGSSRHPSLDTVAALAIALDCNNGERQDLVDARHHDMTAVAGRKRGRKPNTEFEDGGLRLLLQRLAALDAGERELADAIQEAIAALDETYLGRAQVAKYTDDVQDWLDLLFVARERRRRIAEDVTEQLRRFGGRTSAP